METSTKTCAKDLIKAHAAVVTAFIEKGPEETKLKHAVPSSCPVRRTQAIPTPYNRIVVVVHPFLSDSETPSLSLTQKRRSAVCFVYRGSSESPMADLIGRGRGGLFALCSCDCVLKLEKSGAVRSPNPNGGCGAHAPPQSGKNGCLSIPAPSFAGPSTGGSVVLTSAASSTPRVLFCALGSWPCAAKGGCRAGMWGATLLERAGSEK